MRAKGHTHTRPLLSKKKTPNPFPFYLKFTFQDVHVLQQSNGALVDDAALIAALEHSVRRLRRLAARCQSLLCIRLFRAPFSAEIVLGNLPGIGRRQRFDDRQWRVR